MTIDINANIKKPTKSDMVIEYLFYLLVLLYFTGKVFKPITFFIDAFFIYAVLKDVNKKEFLNYLYNKYKSFIHAILFFIGYLLFQSLILEKHYETFKSSFETIMYLILIFAALYNFSDIKKVRRLIFVSYAILAFLALDSFYQYFTGYDFFGYEMFGERITAWHELPKVNLMMGQFFGLLFASVLVFKDKEKLLAIFMLVVSLILFTISGNRSPLVALFPVIFLILILLKNKKVILTMFFSTLLLSLFVILNPKLKTSYSAILNPLDNKSNSGRTILYKVGVEVIKDKPLLGIGSANFRYYFKEYFEKLDKTNLDPHYVYIWKNNPASHVHSVFLDMFISYGIIGVFFFLYLLYQIYIHFIKNNKIGLIASIGFLYCITPLQFGRNFTMGDWQFITYLGLIFLIVMSLYKKLESNKLEQENVKII